MNAKNTKNGMVTKLAETAVMIRVHVYGWSGTVSDSEWKEKLAKSMGMTDGGNIFGIYGRSIPPGTKRALESRVKAIKDLVLMNSVPFMDGGWRIMPVRLYLKLRDRVNVAIGELRMEIESIDRNSLVEYCKALYGPNYKSSFVPSETELRSKFQVSFKVSQVNIGVSEGGFEGLDAEQTAKVKAEAEEQIKECYSNALKGLVKSVLEVLENLKKTATDENKRMSVRRTMGTMTDGLKQIVRFNLTRDQGLIDTINKVFDLVDDFEKISDRKEVIGKCSEAQKLLESITF